METIKFFNIDDTEILGAGTYVAISKIFDDNRDYAGFAYIPSGAISSGKKLLSSIIEFLESTGSPNVSSRVHDIFSSTVIFLSKDDSVMIDLLLDHVSFDEMFTRGTLFSEGTIWKISHETFFA